jgi:hypothetical protein
MNLVNFVSKLLSKKPEIKNLFTKIYEKKEWGDLGTLSGPGSTIEETAIARKIIPEIIRTYAISSFIDAPCGDFFWMKKVNFGQCIYLGLDVVEPMIQNNNNQFGNEARKFMCADLIKDTLPSADLIFCRDCIVHLSLEDGLKIIQNFKKSGAQYLLITHFENQTYNKQTTSPIWRPLNLRLEPFNFPEPLMIINEQCKHDSAYPDKSLGLWNLNTINV